MNITSFVKGDEVGSEMVQDTNVVLAEIQTSGPTAQRWLTVPGHLKAPLVTCPHEYIPTQRHAQRHKIKSTK